jgi:hypothetical protein
MLVGRSERVAADAGGMSQCDGSHLGESFSVATAMRAGWTRYRLSADGLERPFHGVRSVSPFDAESREDRDVHVARLRAYATVMGAGSFFTHVSAAVAWGLPLPLATAERALDVGVFSPARLGRAAGTRGHEVAPRLATVVPHPVHGFLIADPASTWAMLGAVLRDPYDLIAAGDAVVRMPQHPDDPDALATLSQLHHVTAAGRRVGIDNLRRALPSIRTGSASPKETHTRLALVDAGLPEPVLAHEVFDEAGSFVARLDLAYPERRVAVEYEGEHHMTDPAQWAKDIARYERLAALGWTVIRVTKDDLRLHRRALVARVTGALRAR